MFSACLLGCIYIYIYIHALYVCISCALCFPGMCMVCLCFLCCFCGCILFVVCVSCDSVLCMCIRCPNLGYTCFVYVLYMLWDVRFCVAVCGIVCVHWGALPSSVLAHYPAGLCMTSCPVCSPVNTMQQDPTAASQQPPPGCRDTMGGWIGSETAPPHNCQAPASSLSHCRGLCSWEAVGSGRKPPVKVSSGCMAETATT